MLGGNLYKVDRVNRSRYNEIERSLTPILEKHFGIHYKIPLPYHNKPTFGDVDIILDAGFLENKNWEEPLLADLGDVQVKKVRNVTSVLYMNFQVDFFCVATSRFESTANFMCYNILGNLVGRLYHKFNLKYGEDGLKYVLRGFNDRISEEIQISRDMKAMLEFVDLNFDRWRIGFVDLEDIFQYIVRSKYFCSSSYSEEFFNVRKRATERPDFNAFLDYLTVHNVQKNYPFEREKEIYIPMIDAAFPEANLKTKYEQHCKLQPKLKIISEKFNGKIVMNLISLDGKELGQFIDAFKKSKGNEFDDFIYNSSQELIDFSIKGFYNNQILEKNKINLCQ